MNWKGASVAAFGGLVVCLLWLVVHKIAVRRRTHHHCDTGCRGSAHDLGAGNIRHAELSRRRQPDVGRDRAPPAPTASSAIRSMRRSSISWQEAQLRIRAYRACALSCLPRRCCLSACVRKKSCCSNAIRNTARMQPAHRESCQEYSNFFLIGYLLHSCSCSGSGLGGAVPRDRVGRLVPPPATEAGDFERARAPTPQSAANVSSHSCAFTCIRGPMFSGLRSQT